MMRLLKRTLLGGFVMIMLGSATLSVLAPSTSYAAPHANCDNRFLTFPAWYDGLLKDNDADCNLRSPTDLSGEKSTQLSRYITRIAMNILQIIFQLAAYITVGFLIYGGFVYLTSAGRSAKIERGREMIINSVIGLGISLVAIVVVSFVGRSLGL